MSVEHNAGNMLMQRL